MQSRSVIIFYIMVIWSFTLLRSFLIMLSGKKIFKKAAKNDKTALYPVVNLFTMLEICDVNSFLGILLFIPVLNIIVLIMMSYKLGKVFNTSFLFRMALVFMPTIFYFVLAFSKKQYKLSDEIFFKSMDTITEKNINLMTDEEIKKEVEKIPEEETQDVDSIFKSNIQMMEQVEPYKAAKIDLLGLEKLKNHKPNDNSASKDLSVSQNNNNEIKEQPKDKKDEFEIVDL